ncbi:hypothetical protein [Spodoptera cosmioides nucleopolyhedrovirus]|uniref:Uncharacterized protein n=1 Tax=Spodoptera cosmioides nucleopolyhedrovirus TaxID=2605774 RepID=A0A6B7KGQ1_9ABAC|nr:hypothetical protein [Spodoptera cosmioides nucleopolyhedrovirus]
MNNSFEIVSIKNFYNLNSQVALHRNQYVFQDNAVLKIFTQNFYKSLSSKLMYISR